MRNRSQLTVIASLALAVGVCSAQASYEATILLQNPAAYYRYNTTIDDSETDPNMGYLNLPGAQFFDAHTRGVAGPDLGGFEPENKAVEYTGGYSALPSMNLLTGEATILAWMKTPAAHPNYAGVVFNRGDGNSTITGLDLKGANSFQLGYHWNNDSTSYTYVSGLLVEQEKWNLVAMVGSSEGVRLYRGNSTGSLDSVFNAVPCAPTYLNGTMRVGRDLDAARILSAAGNPAYIDEVTIFSHALSEADIQSIYRTARGEVYAPSWVRIEASYSKMFAGEGTLTARGNGSYGSVEWYKDGEKLEEDGLTLLNPVAGVYSVKLVNSAGSLESETVTVLPASAPSITLQPLGTSRHMYGRVTFSIETEGSFPMTYQWKLNGKDVAGATSSTLSLTGLEKNQFGTYTVVVTNSEGSATSEAAVLTEVPVAVDSFAEAIMKRNPIAFFRFDDTLNDGSSEYDEHGYPLTGVAKDYAGGNDGVYHNLYTHSQIEGAIEEDASKALHFEGSQEYGGWVSTSLQVNNYPKAFTVMGWVRLSTAYNDYMTMQAGYFGQNDVLELGCLNNGTHGGWTSGVGSIYAANDFGDGEWGLFVMAYDGTTLRFYLNGKEAGSRTGKSNFNAYRYYFNIGGGGVRSDPTVNMDFLTGDIDDVAVFDTAMTQDDIISFWNKGRFGPGSAPIISIEPQSIQVYENTESTHTFRVQAGGTEPFTYQWYKDGTALEGDQGTRLTIPLVAESAGNYTVVISNDYGSVSSQVANVQIYPVPQENTYEGIIYNLAPHAYWRLGESSGTLAFDRIGARNGLYTADNTLGKPGALKGDSDTSAWFGGVERVMAPSMGIDSTAEVTMLAWIKSDGVIPHYAGVIFNRGGASTASGMDIANEQVCYHWADGQYSFRSGLYPENNVWNLVALTITPTAGTVYLGDSKGNFTSATNRVAHAAASLNADMQLGGDLIAERRFKGDIDEAVIFNRALSLEEIKLIYQIGLAGFEMPPEFTIEPLDFEGFEEDTVTLSAMALGSPGITWQWYKDGEAIQGATSPTYSFTAFVADSGEYTAVATNPAGSSTSRAAQVLVAYPPYSVDLKDGLFAHLKFDNTYSDSTGNGNDVTAEGEVPFVEGVIGSGVKLVTDPEQGLINSLAFFNGFEIGKDPLTVAFWTKLYGAPADVPWFCNRIVGAGLDNGISLAPRNGVNGWSFLLKADDGVAFTQAGMNGPANTLPSEEWHHLVFVMDPVSETMKVFLDGQMPTEVDVSAIDFANGSFDSLGTMRIGQDGGGGYFFASQWDMDDMGIWKKALSDLDARGIYSAGRNGFSFDELHPDNTPPAIVVQPKGCELYPSDTKIWTLSIEASGTQPRTVTWFKDGEPTTLISQGRTLNVPLTPEYAGEYHAVVENAYGSAVSETVQVRMRAVEPGSYEDFIVALDPVVYYRFEEEAATGAVAKDYASEQDGHYFGVNENTQIPTGIFGDTDGKALHFAGTLTETYVGTPYQINDLAGSFTVLGWIRRSLGYGPYGSAGGYFGQNDVLETGDGSDSRMGGWISGLSASQYTTVPHPDNEWSLFAITYDGFTARYYANEVHWGTATGSVNFSNRNYFFNIGGGGVRNPTGDFFLGDMDEIAVFGYALSAEQIKAVYLKGMVGGDLPVDVPDLGYILGENLILTWPTTQGVTLEWAPTAEGPWAAVEGDITDVDGVSRYETSLGEAASFFRLKAGE